MQQAVKRDNMAFAMQVFRESVADGMAVPLSMVNSLMFLAAGGDQWERYVRGLPALSGVELQAAMEAGVPGGLVAAEAKAGDAAAGRGAQAAAGANDCPAGDGEKDNGAAEAKAAEATPGGKAQGTGKGPGKGQKRDRHDGKVLVPPVEVPPTAEERLAALDELWSYATQQGMSPDSGTYLGLARREALRKDPEASLRWVMESHAKGKGLQLRLFHPAQVGYCLAGDLPALERIDATITSHGLDLTEYEYARLLEGIGAAGTYAQLRAALMRMQVDLTTLGAPTADLITAFFERSAAAAQAFAPAEQGGCPLASQLAAADGEGEQAGALSWRVTRGVEVAADGQCEAAGGRLQMVDLEDVEWDSFAEAIADLARKNMRSAQDFDGYAEWYGRNGPYDILVDAANVAFFGQNHEGGGFQWKQIRAMYEGLTKRYPDKKILVMLHRKRLNDPEAKRPEVQAFITQMRGTKSFYYTPPGANDDWFWLYACVKAKRNGLLVSNDELRDHIFGLLRPKHFLKWKERHIAHYDFATGPEAAGGMFSLRLPRPYTACVQQLEGSAAWMVPLAEGGWVCIRPGR